MSLNYPTAGLSSATEYQVAGLPWLTSSLMSTNSTLVLRFPWVSKFIIVKNSATGTTVNVGVTAAGVAGTNYYPLSGGESMQFDWRVTSFYLKAAVGAPNVSVAAGLTTIPTVNADALNTVTASQGWACVG